MPEHFIKHLLSRDGTLGTTSKDRVLALVAALWLPPEYACALLATSVNHFKGPRDSVIMSFIQNGGGRILDLNCRLAEAGFVPLQ